MIFERFENLPAFRLFRILRFLTQIVGTPLKNIAGTPLITYHLQVKLPLVSLQTADG